MHEGRTPETSGNAGYHDALQYERGFSAFDPSRPVNLPARLTRLPSLVVISDRIDWKDGPGADAADPSAPPWRGGTDVPRTDVTGGYLERLPLACIAAGLVGQAENRHQQQGGAQTP